MAFNYTQIAVDDRDQDSPVDEPLMAALDNNVGAALQLADGSPVSHSVWHPYDMANIGDGNDGVYWDHSVDGNTSQIDTPALVDGFEYAILFNNVSVSTGILQATVQRSTDSGFFPVENQTLFQGDRGQGWLFAYRARDLSRSHALSVGLSTATADPLAFDTGTPYAIDVVRLTLGSSGVYNGGTLALYRRATPGV